MAGVVSSGRVFSPGHSLLKQFIVKHSCVERISRQRRRGGIPEKPDFDIPIWVVMVPRRHELCGGMAFIIPVDEMRRVYWDLGIDADPEHRAVCEHMGGFLE